MKKIAIITLIMLLFAISSSCSKKEKTFKFIGKLEFTDGLVTDSLKKSDIDLLLDRPISLGGPDIKNLTLVNDQGEKISVFTCQQWYRAISKGYYTDTDSDIALESDFVKTYGILKALSQAEMPKKRFISKPKVGINHPELLPVSLLPVGIPSEETEKELNEIAETGVTIQQWVDERKVRILSKSEYSLELEYKDRMAKLSEQMRADFNADGIEDMLVFYYDFPGPLGGTFKYGTVLALTRLDKDKPFQRIKLSKK
ncbi:hypothetical protein FJZ33_02510 [Candidatus Poribacteria bacterium]|nr:hypothetical protein [Candidatus Poribacteria bacterium]